MPRPPRCRALCGHRLALAPDRDRRIAAVIRRVDIADVAARAALSADGVDAPGILRPGVAAAALFPRLPVPAAFIAC